MKIEKATRWGATALEAISALQGFLFVLLGGVSILMIDVIIGALGWSSVLSPQQVGAVVLPSFNLLGWVIDNDFIAGMMEIGPDAFVGLLLMLAARRVTEQQKANKKFLTTTTDWVQLVGLAFGVLIFLADAAKDGLFAYAFLQPLVAAFTTNQVVSAWLLRLGVGLIVACSLAGNVAVIAIIQYAKALADDHPATPVADPATPVADPAAPATPQPAQPPASPQAVPPPQAGPAGPPMTRLPGQRPAMRPAMPADPHRPPTPRGPG